MTRPADKSQDISQGEIDRRLATVFELLFGDVIEDALRCSQMLDTALDGAAILAGEQKTEGAVSDASDA